MLLLGVFAGHPHSHSPSTLRVQDAAPLLLSRQPYTVALVVCPFACLSLLACLSIFICLIPVRYPGI